MMMQELLLKRLKELMAYYNSIKVDFKSPEKAKTINTIIEILESYVKEHPQDTIAKFKLALAYFYDNDEYTARDCLQAVLSYDPQNADALIMCAAIANAYPCIDEPLYQQLCDFQTADTQYMAMIAFLKSEYVNVHNARKADYFQMREKLLLTSISLDGSLVWPYMRLGQLYVELGRYEEAAEAFLRSLANIRRVSETQLMFYDFLDVQDFINSSIKGIWLDYVHYEHILGQYVSVVRRHTTTQPEKVAQTEGRALTPEERLAYLKKLEGPVFSEDTSHD